MLTNVNFFGKTVSRLIIGDFQRDKDQVKENAELFAEWNQNR